MKEIVTIDDILALDPCEGGWDELKESGITSCHISYLSRLPLSSTYIRWAMLEIAHSVDHKLWRILIGAWHSSERDFFYANREPFMELQGAAFDALCKQEHEYADQAIFAVWDARMKELYG